MTGLNIPVTQRSARHEGNVPDDVHVLVVQANDDSLRGERYASGVLDHGDSIAKGEALVLQAVDRMCRLENRAARNVLHDSFLYRGW